MASKKKQEKNKKSGSQIAIFVLLLIVVGVTTGCLFSPVFDIAEVKSYSGENVTQAEVINSANIELGINIFQINDSKVIGNVETLPYVKSAKIYRKFPSTIIIKYEERTPYAIVKYLESYAVCDKYGYILEIKKENTLKNLPIIYGIDYEDITVGKKLEGTSMLKYENCTYVFEIVGNSEFNYSFSEINYDDSTNVKMTIKERDIDVIYGNIAIDSIEEKLTHLSSILKELGDKKGKIDMSSENYLAKTVFVEK